MVTLLAAAFFSVVGIGVWAIGLLLDLPGVSMMGALVFLGLGAVVTGGNPIEYQDGVVENTTTTGNVAVTNTTYTYQEVPTPVNLPLGLVLMISAALMALQSINKFSEKE